MDMESQIETILDERKAQYAAERKARTMRGMNEAFMFQAVIANTMAPDMPCPIDDRMEPHSHTYDEWRLWESKEV